MRPSIHSFLRSQPAALDSILIAFQEGLEAALGKQLLAIHLYGSLPMDDFNPYLSDIDFVVVHEGQLEVETQTRIGAVHQRISKRYPRPNLNGIYLRPEQIGQEPSVIRSLVYHHEGKLYQKEDSRQLYEINPVTWAELALYPLTIYQRGATNLPTKADWPAVHQYLQENINSYWINWLKTSQQLTHLYYYRTLLTRKANAWCVAGVARQWYSLREDAITSKARACEYFLDVGPTRFHQLLTDTVQYRRGGRSRSGWRQKKEMLAFMQYVIDGFNEDYQSRYPSAREKAE